MEHGPVHGRHICVGAREELLTASRQGGIAENARANLQGARKKSRPSIGSICSWFAMAATIDSATTKCLSPIVVNTGQLSAIRPELSPSQGKVSDTIAVEMDAKRQLIALMLERPEAPTPKPKLKPDFLGLP
jgi:hypothetical protein